MRLGTRGSALALAQARWVAARLDGEAELVTITTSGDRGLATEDKSRWTSELERALLEGQIDLAVHSAKDVPSQLAEGLAVVAVPGRADSRDVLCGASALSALPHGARVGTSSLRRQAQLRALRDDLQVVGVRGNVDTRLRKLAAGECEALVLARAGLQRLGRESEIGAELDSLVPAPGQGALLLEGRAELADDPRLEPLHDAAAEAELAAERELVARLGATCNTPLGARATRSGDELTLVAWLGLPDGSTWISDRWSAPADRVACELAERLCAAGAEELLRAAERSQAG